MEKLAKAMTSRTVLVITLMFLIGGVNALTNLVPASILIPIQGVLGLLAAYFKVSPSQDY